MARLLNKEGSYAPLLQMFRLRYFVPPQAVGQHDIIMRLRRETDTATPGGFLHSVLRLTAPCHRKRWDGMTRLGRTITRALLLDYGVFLGEAAEGREGIFHRGRTYAIGYAHIALYAEAIRRDKQ